MAEFTSLAVTQKGRALIAKVIAGQEIQFTKICASENQYDYDQLEHLTEIGSVRQMIAVLNIARTDEYSVRISADISNKELASGYYIHTMGLYANDPDEGEILYAAASETSGNCYVSAYNGVTETTMQIRFVITLINADNIGFDPVMANRAYWFTQGIFHSEQTVTSGQIFYFDTIGQPEKKLINYDLTTSFIGAPEYLPVGDNGKGRIIYELIPIQISETDTLPTYFEQRITCYASQAVFTRIGYTGNGGVYTPWRTVSPPHIGVEVSKNSPTTINILSDLRTYFPWAKSFPGAVVYSNSTAATPAYFDGENLILSSKPAEKVTYSLEFSEVPLVGTIKK